MAANPRKFSEKIALMRAKEAEADAAFHQILSEVSGITKAPEPDDLYTAPSSAKTVWKPRLTGIKSLQIQYGAHPNTSKPGGGGGYPSGAPYGPYKTGSLPNINHSLQLQQQQQQQMQQHHPMHQHGGHMGGMGHPLQMSGGVPGQPMSPHVSMANHMTGSIDLKSAIHDLNSLNGGDNSRRRLGPPQYPAGGANMSLRQQRSRTTDHSTYSPYLTPHPLNGPEWKKFKSDSDIHGSMKQQQQQQPSSGQGDSPNSSGVVSPMIHRRGMEPLLEVGGNTGMVTHDMRSNSGVLPPKGFSDGYPPNGLPLRLPMPSIQGMGVHQAHMAHTMNHTAHNSHAGSLPDLSNLGFNHKPVNQGGQCSPPNDGYGRMVSTSMPPPDSPSAMRPNGSRQHSPLIGSPTQVKQMQGSAPHFQYYPHPVMPAHMMGGLPPPAHGKGPSMMSNSIPVSTQQQQQQQGKSSLEKQMVNETIRRRISDKMLAQQQAQQYRQSSSDIPPSPSSPGSSTPPIRSPDSVHSSHAGGSDSMSSAYVMSPGSHSSLQQQFDQVKVDGGPCVTSSSMYINGSIATTMNSPFISDHRLPMKQHSIPDIILTGVDDNSQYFAKDYNNSGQDSFDANDMFGSDDNFKSDLTPLDLEGLQMLDDPSSVLTDPSTEDQLRLC